MKFWKVLIGLLLAPALQAQIPLDYPYAPYSPAVSYLGPYYPGGSAYYPGGSAYYPGGPGYYPGAYYTGAYYTGTYYPQPCYFGSVCDTSSTFDTMQTMNTLTRRIQQLNETVQLLQAQITVAQAQQSQPRAVETTAPSSERPAK